METQEAKSPKLREETPEVRLVDAAQATWENVGEGLRAVLEKAGPKTEGAK